MNALVPPRTTVKTISCDRSLETRPLVCEQSQHLVLASGKLLWEQFLSRGRFTVPVSKQADHKFTVQQRFFAQDVPNRGNQFGLSYVFEHKTGGTCLECFE